ncbi:4-hydroxy-3-methylbut-2-enyl diphosphate reductase [Sphingomonas crocodyli]|uniref:4-hydroxy-3-methylbut-2-enyl diphosphate reductase n=1 Tax=Sphingomonas crocodyli TaxID=1979270 RepID=UPI0019D1C7E6|nr:4-hydroxy-3-methylbut-2-enyl diphosphate reductase [Sphingomonas crocodyli]
MRIVLAAPRGFCAGVTRAIDAVEGALRRFGAPVYVRRPIVHNRVVMRRLEALGAVFVEEVDDVPEGAVLILSAHGVSRDVAFAAHERKLRVFDAICPLVDKVHREVNRHHKEGRHIILIGHSGHPEIDGTLGQLPSGAAEVIATANEVDHLCDRVIRPLAYAVQTTFAVEEARQIVDALKARFPHIVGPQGSDICYATTNRQSAVRAIARDVDAFIIVGESFSSNARRLAEVAEAEGCTNIQLIAGLSDLDFARLDASEAIGITAAASTPAQSVSEVIEGLGRVFDISMQQVGDQEEGVSFRQVALC